MTGSHREFMFAAYGPRETERKIVKKCVPTLCKPAAASATAPGEKGRNKLASLRGAT